jgi:hypothetical protein
VNKKTKILISVLAGIALCVVAGYAISNASPGANDGHPNSDNSTGPADRVDVVYFHRTQRCYTCRYAEEGTRYALETHFADELASGKVTFQVINVDDKEANADILEKYNDPSYLTLCINAVRDGTDHIEVVTDIWLVIGDDDAFVEIVKSKIEKSLNGET